MQPSPNFPPEDGNRGLLRAIFRLVKSLVFVFAWFGRSLYRMLLLLIVSVFGVLVEPVLLGPDGFLCAYVPETTERLNIAQCHRGIFGFLFLEWEVD